MTPLSERSYRQFDLSKTLLTFINSNRIENQYFLCKFADAYMKTYGCSFELNIEDNSNDFYKKSIIKLGGLVESRDYISAEPKYQRSMLFDNFQDISPSFYRFPISGTRFGGKYETFLDVALHAYNNPRKTDKIDVLGIRDLIRAFMYFEIKDKEDLLRAINENHLIYGDFVKYMIFCSDTSLGDPDGLMEMETLVWRIHQIMCSFRSDQLFYTIVKVCGLERLSKISSYIEEERKTKRICLNYFEDALLTFLVNKKTGDYEIFHQHIVEYMNLAVEFSSKDGHYAFFVKQIFYTLLKYILVLEQTDQDMLIPELVKIVMVNKGDDSLRKDFPHKKTGAMMTIIKYIVDLKLHPNPDFN